MNQAELKKNISTIKKYFQLEDLNEKQKEERRKSAILIAENIKDILYELYYEGFLLGSTETWGYKKNTLTINLRKSDHEFFLTIGINFENNTLQTSLRMDNRYLYFEDVYLKITNKAIDNSQLEIYEFDWETITLVSKQLEINAINLEEKLVKQTMQVLELIEEKEFQLKEFYKNINKEDLFLFNAESKTQVGWEELNNYKATSEDIKITTQNLLNYLSEAETIVKKNELKLVIAHLNLSVGSRYLNVIRQSDANSEEKILMFEEMIKRVLATIDNQQIDGKASLSTRLYSNMFAGMTRGKHIVVRDRILKISPARVGVHIIQDIDLEERRVSGEYPAIARLVELGLEVAKERQIEIDKKNHTKKIKEQNLSAVSHLAKDLGVSLKFENDIIEDFIIRVKLIAKHILDEKEFDFFTSRYNLDNILENNTVRLVPLQSIGDRHGLTRERVRQIDVSSLEKIKSIYTDFPDGEIPKNYLTPIPETFKKTGKKKILTKIGKRFIDNKLYVLGQLESSGFFDIPLEDFVKHSIFKGLNESVVLKYLYCNFPEICDTKSLDYLYASNQLSVRSFNALKNAGMLTIDEVLIEELEFITGLGSTSINEIKNLYNNLENE